MTTIAGEAFESLCMLRCQHHRTMIVGHLDNGALEEIARCHLDHGETPIVGGEKPHVMVVTDIEGLQGVAGGLHEATDGNVLDVETIRMLTCDASVSRIVIGPDSEILDVGRKTRTWSLAQRRAIVARDRHCNAPGCGRPSQWCDVHHSDHGRTVAQPRSTMANCCAGSTTQSCTPTRERRRT